MHNKLFYTLAFCSLLTAQMTMTMTLSTSDSSQPIPHTNPLSTQSGRLSHSYSENPVYKPYSPRNLDPREHGIDPREIEELEKRDRQFSQTQSPRQQNSTGTDEIKNIGRFTSNPRPDLVRYKAKYGTSRENLCYKHAYKDENENDKKVIYQVTEENKKEALKATHIEISEYDENGRLHEYVIELEKTKHKMQPLEEYNAVFLCLADTEDTINLSYEKDNEIQVLETPLSALLANGEYIIHTTPDNQQMRLNLPRDLNAQIARLQQESQEIIEQQKKNAQESKSWRGFFLSAPILNVPCYQGVSISFERDGNDYLYTITYKNESGGISTAKVNHSKALQATHKYILIRNKNDENDSFIIELPQQKEELTQEKNKKIDPDKAKPFKKYYSWITPVKAALGISTFAAIMIAILYHYDKLPQGFINALAKIGIVHAE